MDLFAVSTVLLLVVGATWFHLRRLRSAKLPPGPRPFPIIGNILQLGATPHRSLAELSKTYGPLMSLHLGRIYTVVVTSPEIAKEILQKHDQAFSSRTIAAAAQAQDHHKVSMVYLPHGSNEWRKTRKICREQIFSTHRLDSNQGLRQEKLQRLRDYVRKCCENGRVVNIAEALFITTLNLMSATLFSIQVTDFDSDESQEFKKTFESMTNIVAVPNIGDFFPILKAMDLQGIQRKSDFYFAKMLGLIDDLISERLQLRAKSSVKKNDFLETILDLNQGSEYGFSINFIKHLLLDILFAGSDTTSSTAEWAMTELLHNPEKLSKAKHELTIVIGQNKQIQESDMPKLPYLQAVIKEVLRLHPAAPLLVPRKSDYDVQVSGYVIPKDTQVFVNVWAFSRDERVWPNPDLFEPQRFLDGKVDFKGRDFEFIPFGSGRRICPGLPLADRMLPMLVATLIHNFDWKLEPGLEPDMAEKFGIVLHKAVPLKAIPIKL